jgi:thiol-disulfide isomerase/thioredoxin
MCKSISCFVLLCFPLSFALIAQAPTAAQPNKPEARTSGPSDPKAKKTFDEALLLMKDSRYVFALEGFRKADKQDGGHCIVCEQKAWDAAVALGDFKAARAQTGAMLANATAVSDKVNAQFLLGETCLREGIHGKRDDPLVAADSAFQTALQLQPNSADCLYADGEALAYLKRYEDARERFRQFLRVAGPRDIDYARVARFVEHPELARAKMAPNFGLKTLDGRTLTLESLTGKVVLIDFWATWCGPCREALPHIRKIAQKFDGLPLVVLSVSLDKDEGKWKDFVAKNGMTWLQYRDGGFDGRIATQFGVNAIPATFTIDADGVLEDQHVGDADIEGKLKKLVSRAEELNNSKPQSAAPSGGN